MIDLHIDLSSFADAAKHLEAAGNKAPDATRRAINHTGDKTRTAMRIALVGQTGLKRKTMNKALRSRRASKKGGMAYTIVAKGGSVRLKFFAARETRKGVTANPWRKRKLYARSFMKGGKFPNRVPLNLGGNVVIRAGSARYPLRTVKSGLFIPEEMVKGQSAEAFNRTVQRDLPARIAHEINRVL